METPGYIGKLRIVGGDVALDFVNTEDGDPPVDPLRGYGDLVAWGVLVGLLSAEEGDRLTGEADLRPGDAEAAYRDALTLRGAIYDVFRAVAENGAPASRDLEILREYDARLFRVGSWCREVEALVGSGRVGGTWPGRCGLLLTRPRGYLHGGIWIGSSFALVATGSFWTPAGTAAGAGAPWRYAARKRRCAATSRNARPGVTAGFGRVNPSETCAGQPGGPRPPRSGP